MPDLLPESLRPVLNICLRWIVPVVAILLFTGCGSGDEEINCEYKLNQKAFSEVAADTNCSTYERASAELGLAGFLFANFLADDASDNMKAALGIPTSVTAWNTWSGKVHYENARRLSGDATGDQYENQSRSGEDAEIHYFATTAALLAQSYIELDQNSDGDISDTEKNNFTRIRDTADDSYGENVFDLAEWFQFVINEGAVNEEVYLLNTATSRCLPKATLPKYDGIWSTSDVSYDISSASCGIFPSPDTATLAAWAVAGEAAVSITGACTPILKIEEIQNLFLTTTNPNTMSVLDLTENFVSYINSVNRDLTELGIETDSDLRQHLNDFVLNMDNGANCSSQTKTEVDQIMSLIGIAAEVSASDYQDQNVIQADQANTISDTPVEIPSEFSTLIEVNSGPPLNTNIPVTLSFSCNNIDNLSVRLIYRSGTDYVPYYAAADVGISNTFSTMKNLNFDAQGSEKPIQAGDEIIAFSELICFESSE